MTRTALTLALSASILALGACDSGDTTEANTAQSGEAEKAAGDKTIAASLDQNSRFFQAAKAAGLDATLAGPGPYTVLAPDDAAFGKLAEGEADNLMRPDSRAQLTGLLTYHILPGTVLASDIGKAIDNGQGKAVLATMGGGTLTATKEGDKIVLTDGKGGKSTITRADDQFSNGVVHHIDTVLVPADEAPPPA